MPQSATANMSLREKMRTAEHARHRIMIPSEWTTSQLNMPLVERKAAALAIMFERMPIFIEDGELIVGARTVYSPTRERNGDKANQSNVDRHAFPPYATDEEKRRFDASYSEGSSKGHYVPGFAVLLRSGIKGIMSQCKNRLIDEPVDSKRSFLRAVRISYEGFSRLILRYAELANDMASAARHPRADELLNISTVCSKIAKEPPDTFHEALQLYWFVYIGMAMENYSLISYGRFDQFMEPYLHAENPDYAQKLLECFFIKLNDEADIDCGEVTYGGSNNIILGGTTRAGADATNGLTYACLDAFDSLRLAAPQFNIRLSRRSPEPLLKRACELSSSGLNQIAFYNDETVIESLTGAGIAVEDARDYALDACQDILIDGKSDPFLGGQVALTQTLLEVLEGIGDGLTFEDFIAEYKNAISVRVVEQVEAYRRVEERNADGCISPLPFLSATMQGCIERGRDITGGGLADQSKGFFITSPVNAINSLAAIRTVVYRNRGATLSEIRSACKANFVGFEKLRAALLAAPKWGNDIDSVDSVAKDILEFSCREILKHKTSSGAPFLAGIHQPHPVGAGRMIPATPDGRTAHSPIPVGLSPANGTDVNGPTAVVKSVTKLDHMLCQWNHTLMIQLPPSVLRDPSGRERYESLIKTYFHLGGIELQVNVLDADVLKAAQQEPVSYKDIIVRIWGMSTYFVEIGREYQNDIIARTMHSI